MCLRFLCKIQTDTVNPTSLAYFRGLDIGQSFLSQPFCICPRERLVLEQFCYIWLSYPLCLATWWLYTQGKPPCKVWALASPRSNRVLYLRYCSTYSEFLSHLWIWSLSETTSVVPPTDPWVPRMIMNFDSSRINVGSAVSLDLWILRYSICCVLLTIAPLNQANDAYG